MVDVLCPSYLIFCIFPQADDDGEADSRADLIKRHFTQRIQELTTQIQESESKAAHYNAEVCYSFTVQIARRKLLC